MNDCCKYQTAAAVNRSTNLNHTRQRRLRRRRQQLPRVLPNQTPTWIPHTEQTTSRKSIKVNRLKDAIKDLDGKYEQRFAGKGEAIHVSNHVYLFMDPRRETDRLSPRKFAQLSKKQGAVYRSPSSHCLPLLTSNFST